MSIQAMLNAIADSQYDTMRLGDIIKELEKAPLEADLIFDFPERYPSGIDSWRGVYAQLSIWHSSTKVTVGEFLPILKKAVGKTFQGYKGGDYIMDEGTLVHVANWGRSDSTVIERIDLSHADGRYPFVVIHTRWTNQ